MRNAISVETAETCGIKEKNIFSAFTLIQEGRLKLNILLCVMKQETQNMFTAKTHEESQKKKRGITFAHVHVNPVLELYVSIYLNLIMNHVVMQISFLFKRANLHIHITQYL